MQTLHEDRPGGRDPNQTHHAENDRLDQQVEAQQAGERGAEGANGDEDGKER
jgi:hypothetical protein